MLILAMLALTVRHQRATLMTALAAPELHYHGPPGLGDPHTGFELICFVEHPKTKEII